MSRTRSPSRPRPASTSKARRRSPSATTATIAAAAIGAAATIAAAAVGAFGHTTATRQSTSTASATPAPTAPASPRPATATGPLIPGDNSAFITDLTYPDGSAVAEGQRFTKTWEIKNTGAALWAGRYLAADGPSTGLCTYPPRVPIPVTHPGQDATISVPVTASSSPGLCFVTWKMQTSTGSLYFPNEIGIWFNVKVSRGPR